MEKSPNPQDIHDIIEELLSKVPKPTEEERREYQRLYLIYFQGKQARERGLASWECPKKYSTEQEKAAWYDGYYEREFLQKFNPEDDES
jgi:hypothetical protein